MLRPEGWLWSDYALPPPVLRPLILIVADRSGLIVAGQNWTWW